MNNNNITSIEEWAASRCLLMAEPLGYIPCKDMSKDGVVVCYDKDLKKYRNWPNWSGAYREMRRMQRFLERLQQRKVRMGYEHGGEV